MKRGSLYIYPVPASENEKGKCGIPIPISPILPSPPHFPIYGMGMSRSPGSRKTRQGDGYLSFRWKLGQDGLYRGKL